MTPTRHIGAKPARALIVDDHLLLRQGLKAVLGEHFENLTFGEAASAREALALAVKEPWDVVILDISMPGRGGLEVLKELKHNLPKTPVIVLSIYPEEQLAIRVLKLGAANYVQKNGSSEELLLSVEAALRGARYITQSIAQRLACHVESDHLAQAHESLSDREYQVMCLLGAGKTVKEIGCELSLSVKTISTYRSRILEKLNFTNNSQLVHYTMQHRLIEAAV